MPMMARLRLNITYRIIPIIITRIPITRILHIMSLVFSSSEGRIFGLHQVCLTLAGAPLVATLPVIAKPWLTDCG